MSAPRLHVLIPAAGVGARAETAQPKQYQTLAGQAMVLHTLQALSRVSGVDGLNVVVSPGDTRMAELLATQTALQAVRVWPVGGDTRAASVAGGLTALGQSGAQDHDWVLVHDAARCLIQPTWVERLISACRDDEVGGILALPLADTLKQAGADARVRCTLVRDDKWLAQTPQMFRLGLLQRALRQTGVGVTDEASAIEALGLQPMLVPGNALNVKVTYPEDLLLAETLLSARPMEKHA
jgi:2-C-methyl-D-erythritol 4-phosphate cytidylyltransferase